MNCLQTSLFCLVVFSSSLFASEIIFRNEISEQTVSRFIEENKTSHARTLVIDSAGGEVEAGIKLGQWLHSRGMDVTVKGVCLSSCANYVFTAGKHKTVLPGSVVAWHGNYHHLDKTGLWRDDVALRMRRDGEDEMTAVRKVRAQVDKLVGLEKAFFKQVAVNEYLCWAGKRKPFSAPDYYTLSADDMQRFGVKHVSLPAGYAEQDFSLFDEQIEFIELSK